jgi:hypothetical protein
MAPEAIVCAVLFRAVKDGARVLRSAGWRVLLLAPLYLVFLPLAVLAPEAYTYAFFIVVTFDNIVTFAVVRVLGAHREAPPIPAPEAETRPAVRTADVPVAVGAAPLVRPVREVSSADRAPRHALRQAGKLARPALRLAFVQFLALYAALLGFLAVSGGRLDITDDLSLGDELMVLAGIIPLAALVDAFLYLAWQRIALEGDDRVLVAVSQSVRIARKHYGTLLVLVLAESLLQIPVVLSRDHAAMIAAVFVVGSLLRLLVMSAANEVYAAGPRLDVPEDFGRRARR